MRILNLADFSYNNSCFRYAKTQSNPSFMANGKPLSLQYFVNEKSSLLPKRVLDEARLILQKSPLEELPSLLELHKKIYAPILQCNSLDEVKALFPEFVDMKECLSFERNNAYKKRFNNNCGDNFALYMMKEYWAKLKTKTEIAQDLGLKSRSTLDWPLEQINFVSYNKNYYTLLKNSDKEGNRIVADKTRAWNQLHPDLMQKRNKHAAQANKKPENREALSKKMKERDKIHPERAEKISDNLKRAWGLCPEIRQAFSEFLSRQTPPVMRAATKESRGEKLNSTERRMNKGLFKRFWNEYPELKAVFAEALRKTKD